LRDGAPFHASLIARAPLVTEKAVDRRRLHSLFFAANGHHRVHLRHRITVTILEGTGCGLRDRFLWQTLPTSMTDSKAVTAASASKEDASYPFSKIQVSARTRNGSKRSVSLQVWRFRPHFWNGQAWTVVTSTDVARQEKKTLKMLSYNIW
jgi:hypothetical protein